MKVAILILVSFVVLAGCSKSSTPATSPVETKTPAKAEPPEREGSSHWDRVTDLYEQAKESGETTAANAGEWMTDLYGDAKEMTFDSATDANQWVRQMYEVAKQRGETSASSATEWVKTDLKKGGAWEYKTLVIPVANLPTIEAELNQSGDERWECFWVDKQDDTAIFYLKRSGRSMLRQMPAKELMRLLPLLGSGGDSDDE